MFRHKCEKDGCGTICLVSARAVVLIACRSDLSRAKRSRPGSKEYQGGHRF